ncbi:MAG: type II toxin-antitoxin system VapC family toxin [Thermoanaerobaculia bacterium]
MKVLRGPVYVDSSALAKIFLPEPQSEEVQQALRGRTDLLISDLVITELVSSFSRHRREGRLASAQAAALTQTLYSSVESGDYNHLDLGPEIHREAERLLLGLESTPLRASDALHLALAATAGAGTVLTFDVKLGSAARQVGLDVPQ